MNSEYVLNITFISALEFILFKSSIKEDIIESFNIFLNIDINNKDVVSLLILVLSAQYFYNFIFTFMYKTFIKVCKIMFKITIKHSAIHFAGFC